MIEYISQPEIDSRGTGLIIHGLSTEGWYFWEDEDRSYAHGPYDTRADAEVDYQLFIEAIDRKIE